MRLSARLFPIVFLMAVICAPTDGFAKGSRTPKRKDNYSLLQANSQGVYTVSECEVDRIDLTQECIVAYQISKENADQLADKFFRVNRLYKRVTLGVGAVAAVSTGLVGLGLYSVYFATGWGVGTTVVFGVAGMLASPVAVGASIGFVASQQVLNPKSMRQLRASFVEHVEGSDLTPILLSESVYEKFVARNGEFLEEVQEIPVEALELSVH